MFNRLKQWWEGRATFREATPTTWLYSSLTEGSTSSGQAVNEMTAITFPAVFAAVRLLAESVASLPLVLYRPKGEGRTRATSEDIYYIMHDQPNPEMTSFRFRELMMAYVALWGNAIAEIRYSFGGRPSSLWPIGPWRVSPGRRKSGERIYIIDGSMELPQSRVFHVPGFGVDENGWGLSPIRYHRESIGTGLAAEKFGGAFFANASRPSGVLEHPGKLSDDAKTTLAGDWKRAYAGDQNVGKTPVLEEGMKWRQLTIPPDDAQYLQTRGFQVTEIARIFRVPPHMIGDLEKATFSNISEQQLSFYVDSLRPWLVRWEQELNIKLKPRRTHYFEFLVDGMLRADVETRYKAYRVAHDTGFMTKNEIRKKENLNPYGPEGDVPMQALNLAPLEDVISGAAQPAGGTPTQGEGQRTSMAALGDLLRDQIGRVVRMEANALRRQMKRKIDRGEDIEAFRGYVKAYYMEQFPAKVEEVVDPILRAAAKISGSGSNAVATLAHTFASKFARLGLDLVDSYIIDHGEVANVATENWEDRRLQDLDELQVMAFSGLQEEINAA